MARLIVSLILSVPFAASVSAQAPPTTSSQDVLGTVPSVVRLESARGWMWPVVGERPLVGGGEVAWVSGLQQVIPGWQEGAAAANEQDLSARRVLGFVGGLAMGFFGLEAMAQDNEPLIFGGLGLAGAGLAGSAVLWVGGLEPTPMIMEELESRGADYRNAFMDGYASRLASRRTRAGLVGSGLGFGVGVAVLIAVVSAWCKRGDC